MIINIIPALEFLQYWYINPICIASIEPFEIKAIAFEQSFDNFIPK